MVNVGKCRNSEHTFDSLELRFELLELLRCFRCFLRRLLLAHVGLLIRRCQRTNLVFNRPAKDVVRGVIDCAPVVLRVACRTIANQTFARDAVIYFLEPVTAMELAPDGAGYRLNTRFARFINVPELMQMFCQVADIQTADTLKLPIPEMQTGKPMIVRAPSTPELKEIVKGLVQRAEAIRSGRVPPQDDNMLKITSEGRKAALDLRVLNPRAKDQPESKINLAADRIFEVWKDTHENRCAQMVFCDLSTPSKLRRQFSAYDDLKTKLVDRGIPAEQIAFMQDFDSDVQKHILFKDVRSGKIRILMGSTMKMGAGTNVQERLVALHHLDAPWRPADVEQREGRILRQGNPPQPT